MSTKTDRLKAHIQQTFARHAIRRETGWTWDCRKPGVSAYAYRVTWCPYNLVVTGDIGELVITHYSFTDPWAAAAWINGADFHYFMEKSNVQKAYNPEATSQAIMEEVYCGLRGNAHEKARARDMLERIAQLPNVYSSEHEHTPAWRKEILGQITDISEHDAYEVTGDAEALLYRYPERERWKHEALKLWADWMWDNEPAWHKAVRIIRRFRREIDILRRSQIIFGPIRYEYVNEQGKPSEMNGGRYWVFKREAYRSVHPLVVFGADLSYVGLWRESGSVWPVGRRSDVKWRFRDVRST